MPDRDELVDRCLRASQEAEPLRAVKTVLKEAVTSREFRSREVGVPTSEWLDIWYSSPTLTVLNAVWPPRVSLFPHDHRVWAAIGIYGGQEDNTFFRRQGETIMSSGGKELREGDVLLMGDDTIHAVDNPLARYTGAIHVYGGDFVKLNRSQWDPVSLVEAPYDLGALRAVFDQAQRAFQESQ